MPGNLGEPLFYQALVRRTAPKEISRLPLDKDLHGSRLLVHLNLDWFASRCIRVKSTRSRFYGQVGLPAAMSLPACLIERR